MESERAGYGGGRAREREREGGRGGEGRANVVGPGKRFFFRARCLLLSCKPRKTVKICKRSRFVLLRISSAVPFELRTQICRSNMVHIQGSILHDVIDSGLRVYHESRRCSRGTYPETCITKYTSIRRKHCFGLVLPDWLQAYRSTSLIRTPPLLGPYSRTMPRDLW